MEIGYSTFRIDKNMVLFDPIQFSYFSTQRKYGTFRPIKKRILFESVNTLVFLTH